MSGWVELRLGGVGECPVFGVVGEADQDGDDAIAALAPLPTNRVVKIVTLNGEGDRKSGVRRIRRSHQ